jgi:hypothetical protein
MRNAMRILFCILLSVPAFAADKFVPAPTGKNSPQALCQAKVEKLIRSTAVQMGYKGEFGFSLQRESAGSDLNGRPLVSYKSSVFHVDEGYLSESGAEATVRNTAKDCDVLKLRVSVGG